MASEVDICNQALFAIGADRILSLDAVSKEGKLCKELYPKFRDQENAKHRWNFSLKRVQLAASATNPVWGYGFSLPLPSDLLRLVDVQIAVLGSVSINNSVLFLSRQEWKVEGNSLLADQAPLNILYTAQITDSTAFPVFFVEVLAAKLAAELVVPLRNSDMALMDRMQTLYERKTSVARFSDAMEDAPKSLEAEEWIDSRSAGTASQLPNKIVGF